jgi:hypothetical protein
VLLVHVNTSGWVAQTLREAGAEVVEGLGSWEAVRAVHSEIFAKAVSKREADVLRAVAVAEAALARRQAVFTSAAPRWQVCTRLGRDRCSTRRFTSRRE